MGAEGRDSTFIAEVSKNQTGLLGGKKTKKKNTFCPRGDIAIFIVSVFVLWQIHAKLKNVTSGVKVSWVAANGQVFHKEKKDEWKQSDRFEC